MRLRAWTRGEEEVLSDPMTAPSGPRATVTSVWQVAHSSDCWMCAACSCSNPVTECMMRLRPRSGAKAPKARRRPFGSGAATTKLPLKLSMGPESRAIHGCRTTEVRQVLQRRRVRLVGGRRTGVESGAALTVAMAERTMMVASSATTQSLTLKGVAPAAPALLPT